MGTPHTGSAATGMTPHASALTDKNICLDRIARRCFHGCMLATLQIVQSPEKAGVLLQPGRLRLLEQLTDPDSAAGLARRLGVPRQKVNYHLRELEREGFVELFEERRKGNCIERVVQATAREYLIASHAGKATVADRFSAAYLVSTAARAIRDLAMLCL